MNCHDSRTILDAVAPLGRDAAEVEVRDAVAHQQSCAACARWVDAADGFDRWVAPAFRDAVVPEGLRDRLLESLRNEPAAALPAKPTRRKLLAWSAAAAAVLVIGSVWWSLNQDSEAPAELTLASACDKLDAERPFTSLKAFDDSFAPRLPARWSRWVTGSATGIDLDGVAGHDAAIYRFSTGGYAGYLVVVAPGRVTDAPAVTIPHASQANYQMQRVSWTADNQLVVCYLDADGPRMEDFLRELYPQSA